MCLATFSNIIILQLFLLSQSTLSNKSFFNIFFGKWFTTLKLINVNWWIGSPFIPTL